VFPLQLLLDAQCPPVLLLQFLGMGCGVVACESRAKSRQTHREGHRDLNRAGWSTPMWSNQAEVTGTQTHRPQGLMCPSLFQTGSHTNPL
jgi:hypothetical protein